MNNELAVKVLQHQAGRLLKEKGAFVFNYASQDSTQFVSLTMPVRATSYVHPYLHPIFEMHLPEGYLLSLISLPYTF